jgi:hypothetical protein
MSLNQFAKSIEDIVRADPTKALELLVDQLQAIIDQPAVPADHPHAASQQWEKKKAQATMDEVHARLRSMVPLALERLREIVDRPPLPPDDPHAPALQELKRGAQSTLLFWNAHYGSRRPL